MKIKADVRDGYYNWLIATAAAGGGNDLTQKALLIIWMGFLFWTVSIARGPGWLTHPISVAVKAGGMRIVQKHQPTATPEPPQKDEDEEEYVASR